MPTKPTQPKSPLAPETRGPTIPLAPLQSKSLPAEKRQAAPVEPAPSRPPTAELPPRLLSLDAYRGFVMLAMVSGGLGLFEVAKHFPDSTLWQVLGYQSQHVPWTGCSFWDLIQPSFMFMAGMSIPFSYASRRARGESKGRIFAHVLLRSFLLIVLGIFLSSLWSRETNFTFVNVLTQIGLGYAFVYTLRGIGALFQLGVVAVLLFGYGYLFYYHHLPGENYDYQGLKVTEAERFRDPYARHWDKNANFAFDVDVTLLNLFRRQQPFEFDFAGKHWVSFLFYRTDDLGRPMPFRCDEGGYTTLNFVPSMATMIFGLMAGELLRRRWGAGSKFLILVFAGVVCLLGGMMMDHTIWPDWFTDVMNRLASALGKTGAPFFERDWTLCPIVKRIWTPTWAVFSAGWTFLMLAGFYLVIDWVGLRGWTLPLVVVGMNSIAMYCMAHLFKGWIVHNCKTHLGGNIFDGIYGPILQAVTVMVVLWLFCLWMYRRRVFLRI